MCKFFGRIGLVVFMHIAAAVGVIAAACAVAEADAYDVSQLGNEIVPQLDSVAHVLNNRKCLTDAEKKNLLDYLNQLSSQIKSDRSTIGSPEKLAFPLSSANAFLRLDNLQNQINRDIKDVEKLPPCNEKQFSQIYVGGQLLKVWGLVRSIETAATTGAVTNLFSDSGDPIGAGIVVGYNFTPWNNNIIVGPFASFDLLKQTINHTFPNGQFLGTTTHWIITAGAKGGFVVTPGLYLYGLAGASWLNQDLNVNFATAASSNVTTPGFTLGLGGEYQPSSWRLFGNPVSVFLQYQHTWYRTANFNTPTSSPAFNYAFKREDDTIRLGFNVYLSAPTPSPPTRGLITK